MPCSLSVRQARTETIEGAWMPVLCKYDFTLSAGILMPHAGSTAVPFSEGTVLCKKFNTLTQHNLPLFTACVVIEGTTACH